MKRNLCVPVFIFLGCIGIYPLVSRANDYHETLSAEELIFIQMPQVVKASLASRTVAENSAPAEANTQNGAAAVVTDKDNKDRSK